MMRLVVALALLAACGVPAQTGSLRVDDRIGPWGSHTGCNYFFPRDVPELQTAVDVCAGRGCWTGIVVRGIDGTHLDAVVQIVEDPTR